MPSHLSLNEYLSVEMSNEAWKIEIKSASTFSKIWAVTDYLEGVNINRQSVDLLRFLGC